MAQTGYTPILIYSSSTAAAAPVAGSLTNSTLGSELAINITDGKLFYKDNANAVQVIGWKTVPTTAGGTGLTSYTAGDLVYYASGTAFTKLGIGSAYQALQVNAGGTAPSWQPSASSVLTAQGDLLYASAANTLARLAKNTTATRYLANTGTNNDPAWAQVDLSNGVTGTLPTGNGGTGLTSFTANGVVYASSTSALATSSNLQFNGTNLGLGGAATISGMEIIRATGAASPTPVELRLRTTTNDSGWSTTTAWGRVSFYSDDASVGGAKIQAAMQVIAGSSSGGNSTLQFLSTDSANGNLYKGIEILGVGTNNIRTVLASGAGVDKLFITTAGGEAALDNSYTWGASGARWSAIWAANGTIQTSDEREKTDVNNAVLGLDFVNSLRPVSYKWINGGTKVKTDDDGVTTYTSQSGNRTHWGFIAQQVKQAADQFGVDFGGWVLSDIDDPIANRL
jgi:hypothetical protein